MAASQPQPKYPPPPPPGPVPVSQGWQGPPATTPVPGPAYAPPGQPYAAPGAYQAPAGAQTVSPHWGWSIVSLFFFLILGAVAVYYSSQVGTRLRVGNVAGAEDASKKARLFAIISIVIGVLAALTLAASPTTT